MPLTLRGTPLTNSNTTTLIEVVARRAAQCHRAFVAYRRGKLLHRQHSVAGLRLLSYWEYYRELSSRHIGKKENRGPDALHASRFQEFAKRIIYQLVQKAY